MPKIRVHPVGRKIFAFSWGAAGSWTHPWFFRFGRLAGAFGPHGFSLWYRDYDGPCHDAFCDEEGFYQLRLNRTYCNRHCNEWRKTYGFDT